MVSMTLLLVIRFEPMVFHLNSIENSDLNFWATMDSHHVQQVLVESRVIHPELGKLIDSNRRRV